MSVLPLFSFVVSVFFAQAATEKQIVIVGNPDYSSDWNTVVLKSQNDVNTGVLNPGEDAIFYFTLPHQDAYPIWAHATLNLFGDDLPDMAFNVRLRKGNDNFADRDSELKKKTWGEYYDDRLYACDVEANKKYYVQVENPATNTRNSSLTLSVNVDNDSNCKTESDAGKAIAGIFGVALLAMLLFCVGIVAIVVVVCVGCICLCNYQKRSNAQADVPRVQPQQHPYYNNGYNAPQGQVQQQAPDEEAQIPYPTDAQAQAQNPSSEAMDRPLIQA